MLLRATSTLSACSIEPFPFFHLLFIFWLFVSCKTVVKLTRRTHCLQNYIALSLLFLRGSTCGSGCSENVRCLDFAVFEPSLLVPKSKAFSAFRCARSVTCRVAHSLWHCLWYCSFWRFWIRPHLYHMLVKHLCLADGLTVFTCFSIVKTFCTSFALII